MQCLKLAINGNNKLSIETMKYASPIVQNELIDLMANSILRHLINDISERCYFLVMADETSDLSNKEQMCLVIGKFLNVFK